MEYNKNRSKNKEFMIDSFPGIVCDKFRILRWKIYLYHDLYKGYVSRKRNFFGTRLHLTINEKCYLLNTNNY